MGIRVVHSPDPRVVGTAANLAGLGEFRKEADKQALQEQQFAFSQEQDNRDYQLRMANFVQQARNQAIANARATQQQREANELAWRRQQFDELKNAQAQQLYYDQLQQKHAANQADNQASLLEQMQKQAWERDKIGLNASIDLAGDKRAHEFSLEEQRDRQIATEAENEKKRQKEWLNTYQTQIQDYLWNVGAMELQPAAEPMLKQFRDDYHDITNSHKLSDPKRLEKLEELWARIQQAGLENRQQKPFSAKEKYGEGGSNGFYAPNGSWIAVERDRNEDGSYSENLKEFKRPPQDSWEKFPEGSYERHYAQMGGDKVADRAIRSLAEEWKADPRNQRPKKDINGNDILDGQGRPISEPIPPPVVWQPEQIDKRARELHAMYSGVTNASGTGAIPTPADAMAPPSPENTQLVQIQPNENSAEVISQLPDGWVTIEKNGKRALALIKGGQAVQFKQVQ